MPSLQDKVSAVKTAVLSTETCTPATVVTIKELLLPDADSASTAASKTKAASARTTTKPAGRARAATTTTPTEQLSAKEKTALATHVINATIKALTDAAKPSLQPAAAPAKPTEGEPRPTTGKRTLRRSLSAPLSPIQPRTLNRVATSPTVVAKASSKQAASSPSTGCLATAECARVAFACLRGLKGPPSRDQADLQLENGMAALVGKLIGLGMNELALKELRVLHRRLDVAAKPDAGKAKTTAAAAAVAGEFPTTISDLLSFSTPVAPHFLAAVTTCQVQLLRLIASSKKPEHIEAALPHLCDAKASSPVKLLSALAKTGGKEASKAARQLASLSQLVLSLAPSVSSQEDAAAMEPRVSPSPLVAFELQTLAFTCQLRWWRIGGHSGKLDEELLSPLSRCLRALARRFTSNDALLYKTMAASVDGLLQLAKSCGYAPTLSPTAPISAIYQILGTSAYAAKKYDEASQCFQDLRSTIHSPPEAMVRYASICAWLLAAVLKRTKTVEETEQLAQSVLDSLDGSLSGTVSELNELLDSLSLARRSVVGRLMESMNSSQPASRTPDTLDEILKTFVLRYPRFVRRWLGNAPTKDAPPRNILQFDQRRQVVMKTIGQTLDGTLMVVKCDIQNSTAEWQQLDDVLQHCSALLETLSDPSQPPAKTEQLNNYLVKISSLYFAKFSQLRKHSQRKREENKQILQTLSRSIDTVKDLSVSERERAQLSIKLELFADMCKGSGRTEDAVQTLRSICTSMAEDGILKDVSAALATQAPTIAWNMNGKSSMLSRTLRSIAKLDKSWTDWTIFLPETERAAVLEHLMHLSTGSRSALQFHDPNLTALLRIYTPDKYPIRRLRVLLHVLYQNLGNEDEVAALHPHLQVCLRQAETQDKAEDEGLTGFMLHLLNWHHSVQAVLDADELSKSAVPAAIDTWTNMVGSCPMESSIYKVIDDPEALQDYLQSLGHLAGLRGEHLLQLKISQLLVSLSKIFAGQGQTTSSALIVRQSQLASQYISTGLYTKALDALDEAKGLLQQQDDVAPSVSVAYNMAQAEYFTGIGNRDDANLSVSEVNAVCRRSQTSWATTKAQATTTVCLASLLQSSLSLQSGNVEEALNHVKQSVRMLSHDWTKLESAVVGSDSSLSDTSLDSVSVKDGRAGPVGPRVWALAAPLIRSLLHISSVYAHIGMFQETIYYADAASKIAASSQSTLYNAEVAAWTGSIYLRAGDQEKAAARFKALADMMPEDMSASKIRFAKVLGEYCSHIGDNDKALEYFQMAEIGTRGLNENTSSEKGEEATQEAVAPAPSRTKSTRTTRAKTPAKPRITKRAAATSRAVTPVPRPSQQLTDVFQASLLASVLLSRANGLIRQQEWTAALALLKQAKELPKQDMAAYQEQIATATSLIGHSMEQIISDPVFSVIQDSTISFPSIAGLVEKAIADGCSPFKSPGKRGRPATGGRGKAIKDGDAPAFAEALKEAQELLAEAHSSAMTKSDSSMVRRISAMLQNTIILLSATSGTKHKSLAHSGLATVAVDLAHNVTWRREQKTLASTTVAAEDAERRGAGPRRASLAPASDMANFQKSYVEMVPKNWSVISVSLSDNHHDLCLTKFQAGHSPFILRLPLERANSRDADCEVYNFEHGKEDLLDIIKLANETSHSARDFSLKGERNAWWAEREALDTRLKECLAQIETTWLGGFKGIFSQHQRRPDLLARFQKNVQKMLDAHLPSRSQRRGRKTAAKAGVTLDPRILDLFIGLGDPTEDPDCDFDEALNDLLYFIVDILQFHGERNAYDEIDFDAMVVEMYDALKGYYGALERAGAREDGAHTVLVLDKALHAFPWESLPCMQGLAVSRVPSLACLRQLITESNMPPKDKPTLDSPPGHYVSSRSGTYMLNPSSDLKNTQAFFQKPFASGLAGWTSIVNRPPDEDEFERALGSGPDVFLYFGHGSGAQYIRGKTVRRLDKCRPATFLMGCSSAALTEAGEFECYGPVWNYMMAGCPAVVGTLWDVTDRDIDRFAGRAFEEWGLLDRGTFEEAGKQQADEGASARGKQSLVEAVARARGACRFRYLNAAAVVVYGIPVYVR
ncbi:separin [Cordyceps fumosorosea ARSEF 2679]|uniref:separase n=1 Tax=Cordyceps fumosorosea (strain ARSEF 2679) TaxID=1081104 RepID=A0A162I7M1_CORFA|nr:separin [Cordyceps fumosorosea ARSEF 2679]OAA53415.1 separin [Cordyceps fumosorosea ARSEF 2679]